MTMRCCYHVVSRKGLASKLLANGSLNNVMSSQTKRAMSDRTMNFGSWGAVTSCTSEHYGRRSSVMRHDLIENKSMLWNGNKTLLWFERRDNEKKGGLRENVYDMSPVKHKKEPPTFISTFSSLSPTKEQQKGNGSPGVGRWSNLSHGSTGMITKSSFLDQPLKLYQSHRHFSSKRNTKKNVPKKLISTSNIPSTPPLPLSNDPRFIDGKPTLQYAKALPLAFSTMTNEQIVHLAAEGSFQARREALIRNIMSTDSIQYDHAETVFRNIAHTNRQRMFFHHLPHHVGIAMACIGGLGSIPLIFYLPVVSFFNHNYVTADVPEPKDLETWLEVGSWSWAWMEPVIGEISFLLLAVAFVRAQLVNVGLNPWGNFLRERRAMRLVKMFPMYDARLLADFSRSDKYYELSRLK